MKRLKIPIWLAVVLILIIIIVGATAANYYAETHYDYRLSFIIKMVLCPLLFLLLSIQGGRSLIKIANGSSGDRRSRISILILAFWMAAMIGSVIIALLVDAPYQTLSRLFPSLVSVVAGVSFAIMRNDVE